MKRRVFTTRLGASLALPWIGSAARAALRSSSAWWRR